MNVKQPSTGTKRDAALISDDTPSTTNKKIATGEDLSDRPSTEAQTATATSTTVNNTDEKRTVNFLQPLNRDGKNLTEKKIRRLEKNRLSARNCRRKKKELEQHLLKEITTLEGENLKLRLQLKIGEEAEQLSLKEQERVTEELDTLLRSGASDSDIRNNLEEFKTKFMDYGLDRRTAIDFHLRNVERLLMPTTITSVAMRALKGGNNTSGNQSSLEKKMNDQSGVEKTITTIHGKLNDQSVEEKPIATHDHDREGSNGALNGNAELHEQKESPEPTNVMSIHGNKDGAALEPKALFKYLVEHLDVTKEQALALKDSRHVAKELDSALEKALAMLSELRHCLTQSVEDLETEFDSVQSILSDRQTAKFLVWVANNSACMHMLNELWSKVYPYPAHE